MPEAGYFPINYALEDALHKRRRDNERKSRRDTEESSLSGTRGSDLHWVGSKGSFKFGLIIGIPLCVCLIVLFYNFLVRKTLSWAAYWESEEDSAVRATAEQKSSPWLLSLLQEHESKVLAAVSDYKKILSQVDQYSTILEGWHDQQQQLEDKLQAILNNSKRTRMLLQEEESRLATKMVEVQQGEQQLHAVQDPCAKSPRNTRHALW